MNRLALGLLLVSSLMAPAWPGLHAALHARESHAAGHVDAFHHAHDAHVDVLDPAHDAHARAIAAHLGIARDPAHGHEHPELASVVAVRTLFPALLAGLQVAFFDFSCVETVRLAARNESPPPRVCLERGAPDRPRGPPHV
jgi:hypothetical protein